MSLHQGMSERSFSSRFNAVAAFDDRIMRTKPAMTRDEQLQKRVHGHCHIQLASFALGSGREQVNFQNCHDARSRHACLDANHWNNS